MRNILKPGHIGQDVADLQATLLRAGFKLAPTAVYDDATRQAVLELQARYGLVRDGIWGPKCRAALAGMQTGKLLREADLIAASETLGVPVASIKAVNAIESSGRGFLDDGARPVILFERHVFWDRLLAQDIDPAPLAEEHPNIVNRQRGGYAGGAAEYIRLGRAMQICHPAALESASWGAFQIMGYHWQRLGYANIDEFVSAQQRSEGEQLAAFVAFIQADPALHKALRARQWAKFARAYNGPAYAQNLYDVKLARAYDRYAGTSAQA